MRRLRRFWPQIPGLRCEMQAGRRLVFDERQTGSTNWRAYARFGVVRDPCGIDHRSGGGRRRHRPVRSARHAGNRGEAAADAIPGERAELLEARGLAPGAT
jgi:hypothetical protein